LTFPDALPSSPDLTGHRRVLGNSLVHARLAGLLSKLCQLLDRETRVFRGNQRVRLGSDLGQLGNDLLLLVQIQSHCASSLASVSAPPHPRRGRPMVRAVPSTRGTHVAFLWQPLPKKSICIAHSRRLGSHLRRPFRTCVLRD